MSLSFFIGYFWINFELCSNSFTFDNVSKLSLFSLNHDFLPVFNHDALVVFVHFLTL